MLISWCGRYLPRIKILGLHAIILVRWPTILVPIEQMCVFAPLFYEAYIFMSLIFLGLKKRN